MKNKIKPFILRLIKENILYILGNIFIFVLIIITIRVGLRQNSDYNVKITALKTELDQLQNKVTLMNTVIPSSDSLDEDINFLNTLIPNVEDYFSIIYALDRLSQKTNFIISSYTVNIANSSNESLKLLVTGTGDSQSFSNFLENYNFEGYRLITSDKINLSPNFFGSIQMSLTFYSKSVSTGSSLEVAPDKKIFDELETLKSKVNFIFNDSSSTDSGELNYPKKTNPF